MSLSGAKIVDRVTETIWFTRRKRSKGDEVRLTPLMRVAFKNPDELCNGKPRVFKKDCWTA